MILYADRKPVAQFQGPIEGRAPYISKHTRGAYRPTTGRVYYGGGDHQCGGSGLPEDQGDSNANSAFYSMDPNDPTTIVMENHRYLTGGGPDALQPAGADEGALAWDETTDRLICSPVNSFDQFQYAAQGAAPVAGALPCDWTRIPKFVSPTQFSLDNGTAGMYVGQRIRLHLNHPDFPGYTPDRFYYTPSWMDVRITAINGNVVTFAPRPGTRIKFDRDAIGFGPGVPQGDIRGTMWRDNGQVFYDDVAKLYYAGLLFMDPATRTWVREDFRIGIRARNNGTDFGMPKQSSLNSPNGMFVPASITGTHDCFVSFSNSGPDGGWWGYYEWDLVDHVVNFRVSDASSIPPDWAGSRYDKEQPCLDRSGKAAYTYTPTDDGIYKLDFVTRQVTRQAKLGRPIASAGCGHSVWMDAIRSVFIASDGPQAGTGFPYCFLYAPDTKALTALGNTLPDGSAIRGDEVYQAPNTAIFDGGGVDGVPPTHRHVYRLSQRRGTAATFEKLAIAPFLGVPVTIYNPAATDAARAQMTSELPWRVFSSWTVGRNGMAYYRGGSHNGYPGSDTHNADLSKIVRNTIAWRQNIGPPFDDPAQTVRRPRVAPADDLGTAGGIQGEYMYFRNDSVEQYWQMGTQHVYTRNVAYPGGLLDLQMVPNDLVMPRTMKSRGEGKFDSRPGLARWNPATGKWAAIVACDSSSGAFVSTWDYANANLLVFNTDGSETLIARWNEKATQLQALGRLPVGLIGCQGYTSWSEWLEGFDHVVYSDGQTSSDSHANLRARRMWIVHAEPGKLSYREVTSAAYRALYDFNPEDIVTACDYDHRQIYFLKAKGMQAGAELYRSAFETPGKIALASATNLRIKSVTGETMAKNETGHRALQYFAGHLYYMARSSNGRGVDIWRTPV